MKNFIQLIKAQKKGIIGGVIISAVITAATLIVVELTKKDEDDLIIEMDGPIEDYDEEESASDSEEE